MPVEATEGPTGGSARDKLAAEQLHIQLLRHVDGPFEVQLTGDASATLLVPEKNIAMLIGKGGSNVKQLEETIGLKLDIRPMTTRGAWDAPKSGRSPKEHGGGKHPGKGRYDPERPLRRESPVPVSTDEDDAAAGRKRYVAYKQQSYPLTHFVAGQS